ncbi:hypothetical protein ZHAS_00014353 [Anopheles sinensis]|uniref:Uncharacterized protein n=1 Tax=Anopheles sinensis TaxID=74873 RepID=A0A084W8B3_ANOSI|nr:hypothetical protein ZHAS_00014353 [Anopheles sinensis]
MEIRVSGSGNDGDICGTVGMLVGVACIRPTTTLRINAMGKGLATWTKAGRFGGSSCLLIEMHSRKGPLTMGNCEQQICPGRCRDEISHRVPGP